MTEPALKAALDDRMAVAGTIFGEGAGLDRTGREAIASVIRNRYLTPRRYGQSWKNVCLQRSAFSCWWSWGGHENHARLLSVITAILDGKPLPLSAMSQVVWNQCLEIADAAMAGTLPDRVCGSTHYYNPKAMVPPDRVPAWALGKQPSIVIPPHRFYAGIA